MVIRKLFWANVLLMVGQLLQTSALTELHHSHVVEPDAATAPPTRLALSLAAFSASAESTVVNRSPSGSPAAPLDLDSLDLNLSDPDPSDQNAVNPNSLAIRDPLLSSLILPLPPLLLPDLLLPPLNIPSFNSQRLDEELQIYARYLRMYGTPDVLIVGSSRSLQGIDPIALQQGLAAQGYPEVKVFNFGVNGATAQVIDLILREILNQEQLPRLIIWGDGLRAFNDGRPDLTYNEIVASEGYRWLQAGNRPIPVRTFYQDAPVLTASVNPSLVRAALADSTQQISSVLDMYGFQSIVDRFDPASYYQHYPRVPGAFDADYVPFGLGGPQTQATIAVAQYTRTHNIPLVVVNLPLTQNYMDALRLQHEQAFRHHMQQLSEQQQFMFLDLVQHPDLIQNQYFADPSHINHTGARAVAAHIITNTTIPWHVLKPDVLQK